MCVALLASVGIAAAGQQQASIFGQIKDESGGVLPGVTVTAKSPALQVPQLETITDEHGEYRLSPLPVGEHVVEYALGGFQTIRREGVQLTLGFQARLDQMLKVGSLQESVTVSGASPVVDVASSTSTTKLNRETLEILPTGRSGINDILSQAPGTRQEYGTDGSNMSANPNFRAFGQSNEYWSTLEGVVTTPPLGGQGNFYDYSSQDESIVQTIGNDAEMPRRGVYLASVVKSGGNEFHGELFAGQTNDNFQWNNLDDYLRSKGFTSNKLDTRWDREAQAGGKIIENRLWYFGGWRRRSQTIEAPNSFATVQPPFPPPPGTPSRLSGPLFVNEGAAKDIQTQPFYTLKLSYQMTPANKLTGFVQRNEKHWVHGPTQFQSPLSSNDEPTWMLITGGQWQYVRNSMVVEAHYGWWDLDVVYPGRTTEPSSSDITTQASWGDSTSHGNLPFNYRSTITATASWYKPDLFFGNHDLKTGFMQTQAGVSRFWDSRSANNGKTDNLLSGNYTLIFRSGVPFEFGAQNQPLQPYNEDHYTGFFVKDGWTIRRRLTANLGLRFSRDAGIVPEQCRQAGDFPISAAQCFDRVDLKVFNSFAPRIHMSYDLSGDGKTVLKGGWGRFDHMRDVTPEVDALNRNVFTTTTFLWHDNNKNNAYDAGEVNLDPNGPDFVSINPSTAEIRNPDELQPKTDEFSVSIEHELIKDMSIRLTGIYSRNFNTYQIAGVQRPYSAYNIPITNPDPGPDGKVGTADDPGTSVTYYDYAATLAGLSNSQTMTVNPGSQTDQTYKSYEVAAAKRLSRNWQFNGSYSSTLSHIPFGTGTQALTPNAEIFTSNFTREWLGRLSGAYIFPRAIVGSVIYEHRSGTPTARQVQFTGGKQIPNIVVNVEPIGSIRTPNVNTLDMRASKTFDLGKSRKLEARVNMFNVLNINTALAYNVRSGSSFLLPTTIVLPRVLDFSVVFRF